MQPPQNPARRNRNIGTAKQGHGQNNRLVIPQLSTSLPACTAWLNVDETICRKVHDKDVCIIVEKTSGGCVHACSAEDILHLLRLLPSADWAGLSTFVLRQSTEKMRILNPAWGRLFYHAELGFRGSKIVRSGPAVFLESVNIDRPIRWSTALDPEDSEELERLRTDGHAIARKGKRYTISSSVAAVRATQLYRTLPHEIGHWLDWLTRVEEPLARREEFTALSERYFARPNSEREAFAHRYADDLRRALLARGAIPFAQMGHEGVDQIPDEL